MTTIPAGVAYTLRAEWHEYPGGPAVLVTGVQIQITRLSDVQVIVGPTGTDIVHVATGLDVYSWTPDPDTPPDTDFAVVWTGVGPGSVDVEASEIITVGFADVTNDPTTVVGKIRLLISDTNLDSPTFTDTSLTGFYAMSGSNVRLAAAQALDAIATSEVLVSKVIRTLDLQTDGAKVAAELRAQAQQLRATAADYDADGNLFGMSVVDFQPEKWWLSSAELAEGPC